MKLTKLQQDLDGIIANHDILGNGKKGQERLDLKRDTRIKLEDLIKSYVKEVIGELDHGIELGDVRGAFRNTARNVLRLEQLERAGFDTKT